MNMLQVLSGWLVPLILTFSPAQAETDGASHEAYPRKEPQYTTMDLRTLEQIRALRGVPEEERVMSVGEVLDALAVGEQWALFALELRAEAMEPEELQALAEQMAAMAPEIADLEHTRLFATGAATVLPGPLMLPVVELALFEGAEPSYESVLTYIGAVSSQAYPLTEAIPQIRALYWIARYDENIREYENQHDEMALHHLVIGAMGALGEDGIDLILETGIRGGFATQALSRIGTERALDILMQWCEEPYKIESLRALSGFGHGGLQSRPAHVQAFVLEELAPLFHDDDPRRRMSAVDIASSAAISDFVPHIIALRDRDQDAQVAAAAERGVEYLWGRLHSDERSALVHARRALEGAVDRLAFSESQLADPRRTAEQRAYFSTMQDEAAAQIPELEAEIAALEELKAKFFAGELAPSP